MFVALLVHHQGAQSCVKQFLNLQQIFIQLCAPWWLACKNWNL
jgi:hypothetical protein